MDKDYEKLLEQYEDAVLRIVMYRVAQEDGKRLLEEAERLEQEDFQVPEELDKKCLELIRTASAPAKQRPSQTPAKRRFRLRTVGKVLLAAVLAAVLLFTVVFATVEEFRIGVLNFFLELRENGSTFFFNTDTSDTPLEAPGSLELRDGMPFEFTYIPEGYELLLNDVYDGGENKASYVCAYGYPNDDPNNFRFTIEPISEGTGLFVDTEDATVTELKLYNHDGYLIQKNHSETGRECVMYLWFDLENKLAFSYDSINIPFEESKRIFDGIVIYGLT